MKAENISRSHQADNPARRPPQSATGSIIPPAEELRGVAEEVRLAFPRPLRAPQLVLIDVDPRHLHAFWTLDAASVDAARRASASAGRELAMMLRISGTGDAATDVFDVEVAGLQGQCYVDIWGEGRSYRGELGLRRADGSLDALAPAALVELPNAGPAGQAPKGPVATVSPPDVARVAEVAETPAAAAMPAAPPALPAAHELPEPARHPFPLPPTEAGAYDPERRPVAPAAAAESPPPGADAPPPMPAAHELPEPVRHPFPLPPVETGGFDPHALIGGFVSPDTPIPEMPVEARTEREEPSLPAPSDQPPPAAQAGSNGAAAAPDAVDPASLLPLENVLTLSSFALGRDTVEFEINAELHVFGRARPGTRLQLFGRPIALRPDGSFSITRPLPEGALIFSSLLMADEADISD